MPITVTPTHTLTAQQSAQQTLHQATSTLAVNAGGLVTAVAGMRAVGADCVHGASVAHSNEVFASQPDKGVSLVVDDILLALLAGRNASAPGVSPETLAKATRSPVPEGRILTVNGADVDTFRVALINLIYDFESRATGVTVI